MREFRASRNEPIIPTIPKNRDRTPSTIKQSPKRILKNPEKESMMARPRQISKILRKRNIRPPINSVII